MLVTIKSQRVNIEDHPVISLMCHPLLIKLLITYFTKSYTFPKVTKRLDDIQPKREDFSLLLFLS